LLQTIVEQTLKDVPGTLKEVALASILYEQENYDPRSDSRVRVDATTLRNKLEQYYSTDGIKDEVLIEIPRGAYVASFKCRTPVEDRRRNRTRIASITFFALVACAGILILSLGLRWRVNPANGLEAPVQLTFDGGFTSEPSISADGNTLVYASDRGKGGVVHIWIKSGNAPPRQLTDGSSHDFRPELSPDGRFVAFRSLRAGDGVFTVPASGGTPTLLAKTAYSQRFSPDGRQIAYAGTGRDNRSHILVMDVAQRSEPRRIDFGVAAVACPVWTPDGRNIVFLGQDERDDWDYWSASIDFNRLTARRLGIQAALRDRKLPALHSSSDCPQDWIGNRLLFLVTGDEPLSPISSAVGPGNAFQVLLSPTDWLPRAPVEVLQPRLHTDRFRVARDRSWIVFTAERKTRSVWSLSLPSLKPPVFSRVLEDPAIRSGFWGTWPGLSANGNVACFVVERIAKPEIVCKDLISGTERQLSAQPVLNSQVLPDTDGQRVAFLGSRGGQTDLIVKEISTGAERFVSSECPVLLQWTADQSSFLCSQPFGGSGPLYRIALATGRKTRILTLKNAPIYAQLSPDGLWLALVAAAGRTGAGQDGLVTGYLISLTGNPEDTSRWIKLTEEPFHLSLHWAPDGGSIYYWQIRDGSRCLWGQHLDRITKQPLGPPFAVLHRHTYQAYPDNGGTLAVAGPADRLRFAMTLSDNLSDLWRVTLPPQ
jgi:Tol biopolymer transport system component